MTTLLTLALGIAQALGQYGPAPRSLVEAAAEAVAADERPMKGSNDWELAVVMTWMAHESGFVMRPAKRWDSKAYCAGQVHGPVALERDERACVRAMLVLIHQYADLCGDDRAMAGYSSGTCDRAVRKADWREREAALVLELARPTEPE